MEQNNRASGQNFGFFLKSTAYPLILREDLVFLTLNLRRLN